MILDLSDLSKSKDGWGDNEFMAAVTGGLGCLVDEPANSAAYIDEGLFSEAASSSGNGYDPGAQVFINALKG